MPDPLHRGHLERKEGEIRKRDGMKGLPIRVVLRYALLQLPGLALLFLILLAIEHWVYLPLWFFGGSLIVWILKDVILFPFVWRAYDSRGGDASETMLGKRGIVKERLDPSGYIQLRGELWRAEAIGGHPIEEGERVRVLDMRGLTLFVRSDPG